MKRLPRLRFPEFEGDEWWSEHRLGDISNPVTERVGNRKLVPVSISAGVGFVPQSEKFGRDISGNQYELYTLVKDGDFVFNKGNSNRFPQGCIYELKGWGEVAAPSVFITFNLKKGYLNSFFQQLFEANFHGVELREHITSGARGNGLLNISKDVFFNIRLPAPSLPEQTHIAACLSSLDSLIAAQGQKLEALQEHKRGLIQKLFPAEGQRVPELRFPEFEGEGEWETLPLSLLAEVVRGGSPRPIEDFMTSDPAGLNWLKIGDVNASAKYITRTAERVKREALSKTRVVRSGELILSNSMSFGRPYILKTDVCIHDGWLAITNISIKVNTEFLFYYLASSNAQAFFEANAAGAVVQNLNKDRVKLLSVTLPQIDEQISIVKCLSALDSYIIDQRLVIDKLNDFKQGLMQRLFPSGSSL